MDPGLISQAENIDGAIAKLRFGEWNLRRRVLGQDDMGGNVVAIW